VAGHLSDLIEGRLLRREPTIPLEAAKMSTTHMSFDDGRARTELGYTSRPAVEALTRAAHWFVDAGYVKPERAATFVWTE
jgi:dihydroflavonol-4-reductase